MSLVEQLAAVRKAQSVLAAAPAVCFLRSLVIEVVPISLVVCVFVFAAMLTLEGTGLLLFASSLRPPMAANAPSLLMSTGFGGGGGGAGLTTTGVGLATGPEGLLSAFGFPTGGGTTIGFATCSVFRTGFGGGNFTGGSFLTGGSGFFTILIFGGLGFGGSGFLTGGGGGSGFGGSGGGGSGFFSSGGGITGGGIGFSSTMSFAIRSGAFFI